jgi:GNAT superfamily N-acetyltransferase
MNHPARLYQLVGDLGRGGNRRHEYLVYRKFVRLGNGGRVMLRFLTTRDREKFVRLFEDTSDDDIRFLKHDVRDPGVLNAWMDSLNYGEVLPLMAENLKDNQFVAGGVLLLGAHAARHMGEIRLFVSAPFQNLGLGSVMLDELINLAARENLRWLKGEVVRDQKNVIRGLRAKGFEVKSTLEDYFLCPDGTTHDVVLMMRPVVPDEDS